MIYSNSDEVFEGSFSVLNVRKLALLVWGLPTGYFCCFKWWFRIRRWKWGFVINRKRWCHHPCIADLACVLNDFASIHLKEYPCKTFLLILDQDLPASSLYYKCW